jgi:hypothetical protein
VAEHSSEAQLMRMTKATASSGVTLDRAGIIKGFFFPRLRITIQRANDDVKGLSRGCI